MRKFLTVLASAVVLTVMGTAAPYEGIIKEDSPVIPGKYCHTMEGDYTWYTVGSEGDVVGAWCYGGSEVAK